MLRLRATLLPTTMDRLQAQSQIAKRFGSEPIRYLHWL